MTIKPIILAIAAIAAAPAYAAPLLVVQQEVIDGSGPLSDPALSQIRGGQAVNELQFSRNAHAMVQQQFDVTSRAINGVATEIFDVWWSSTGLELIAANITADLR